MTNQFKPGDRVRFVPPAPDPATIKRLVGDGSNYIVTLQDGSERYWAPENMELIEPAEPVPAIGDVYRGTRSGIEYTLTSDPDIGGKATCTWVDTDGNLRMDAFVPTTDIYTYVPPKVERPEWPKLGRPKRYLLPGGGTNSYCYDSIAYLDLEGPGVPWRWIDGTPVTDEERGVS